MAQAPHQNYLDVVLEEIALEGLDGITLPSLWLRLEERKFAVSERGQAFLWQAIVSVTDLTFYQLPDPRPDIEKFDRMSHMDISTGYYMHPETLQPEPYTFKEVNAEGVIGSCPSFKTRIDITDTIRDEDGGQLCSIKEAMEKWGRSLVVVASQPRRNFVLTGCWKLPNSLMDHPNRYLLLEWLGRARWNGLTTGHVIKSYCCEAVATMAMGSNFIHYVVKILISQNFVRKQKLLTKYAGKRLSLNLVHLQRFYWRVPDEILEGTRAMCEYLSKQPHRLELANVFRDKFNLHRPKRFKKIMSSAQNYIRAETVPYRRVYPEATQDEYKSKSAKINEKLLKVFVLIKEFREEDIEDEKDEVEDDKACDEEETLMKRTGKLKQKEDIAETDSLLRVIYNKIDSTRSTGIVYSSLISAFGLSYRTIRNAILCLKRAGMVKSVLKTKGRVRTSLFVTQRYADSCPTDIGKVLTEFQQKSTELAEEMPSTQVKDEDGREDKKKPVSQDESALEAALHMEQDAIDFDSTGEDLKAKLAEVTCTLLEGVKNKYMAKPIISEKLTEKNLRYANVLLDGLKEHRVICNLGTIRREIEKHYSEKGENMEYRMCSKTILRVVDWCEKEGKLNKYMFKFQYKERVINRFIVSARDITLDSPEIQKSLEEIKMCFFRKKQRGTMAFNQSKLPSDGVMDWSHFAACAINAAPAVIVKKKPVIRSKKLEALTGMLSKEKTVRYKKYEKAKTFHHYLWYRIYGYQGTEPQGDDNHTDTETGSLILEVWDEDSEVVQEPPVYLDVEDWRRYLAPLKKQKAAIAGRLGRSEGVCLMEDLLLGMPLSIFILLTSAKNSVQFDDYLDFERRKHYPITSLPLHMVGSIIQSRVYIFLLAKIFQNLSSLGLMVLGPMFQDDKTKQSLFLRKTALLLDTRSSLPGNTVTTLPEGMDKFPEIVFQFDSLENVKQYWTQLQDIIVNTDLGHLTMTDRPCTYSADSVPLAESLRSNRLDQVVEDYCLPGDRRGAAGVDSSLLIHCHRRWKAGKDGQTAKRLKQKRPGLKVKLPSAKRQKMESSSLQPDGKNKADSDPGKKQKRTKLTDSPKASMPKKSKVAKPESWEGVAHDEIDQQVLNLKHGNSRAKYSPAELSIVMLGNVAVHFLVGKRIRRVFFRPVRDILHKRFPKSSLCKTTVSVVNCARRYWRLPKVRHRISDYLMRLKQDKDLMEKYSDAVVPRNKKVNVQEMLPLVTDLLFDLLDKFSTSDQEQTALLPVTMEHLEENYNIMLGMDTFSKDIVWSDVTSDADVCSVALRDFELSHLLSASDKQSRNYEMYATLRQYPEHAVSKTFDDLVHSSVIIKSKKTTDPGVMGAVGRYTLTSRYLCQLKKHAFPVQASDLLSLIAASQESRSKSGSLESPSTDTQLYGLPQGCAVPGQIPLVVGLTALGQLHIELEMGSTVFDLDSSNFRLNQSSEERTAAKSDRAEFAEQGEMDSENQDEGKNDSDADMWDAGGSTERGSKRPLTLDSSDSECTGESPQKRPRPCVDGVKVSQMVTLGGVPKDVELKETEDSQTLRSSSVTVRVNKDHPVVPVNARKKKADRCFNISSKASFTSLALMRIQEQYELDPRYHAITLTTDLKLAKVGFALRESEDREAVEEPSSQVSVGEDLAAPNSATSLSSAVTQGLETAPEKVEFAGEAGESVSGAVADDGDIGSGQRSVFWTMLPSSGCTSPLLDAKLLKRLVLHQTRFLPFSVNMEAFWARAKGVLTDPSFTACQQLYKEIAEGSFLGRTWPQLTAALSYPADLLHECLECMLEEDVGLILEERKPNMLIIKTWLLSSGEWRYASKAWGLVVSGIINRWFS